MDYKPPQVAFGNTDGTISFDMSSMYPNIIPSRGRGNIKNEDMIVYYNGEFMTVKERDLIIMNEKLNELGL